MMVQLSLLIPEEDLMKYDLTAEVEERKRSSFLRYLIKLGYEKHTSK